MNQKTKCIKCKNELWLRDEDAGSEKEIRRICEKCQDLERRILELKNQFEISVEPHKYTGGQMCGIMPNTVVGKHEELGIEIKLKCFRQNHKNMELLKTIYDLIFDELVK